MMAIDNLLRQIERAKISIMDLQAIGGEVLSEDQQRNLTDSFGALDDAWYSATIANKEQKGAA